MIIYASSYSPDTSIISDLPILIYEAGASNRHRKENESGMWVASEISLLLLVWCHSSV
ncbi:hypothetical protein BofuT4_uP027220.1 [Botrytis cinerea T4]|uniref:Uncharacterized protein n=1 Tax=Botryotinia fuckeliana (strain T4) TaxID=999810 RepID=G2YAU7_BOTF4|nr:hypothetical protein BofuT4_uP027220.1 [Botrytis cinerea T4]